MLATSPLFCYPDWPRNFFAHFPSFLRPVLPLTSPGSQPSPSCVYEEIQGSGTQQRQTPAAAKSSKLRLKHKLGAIFTVLYLMEQFFLPYSHFITQVLDLCFEMLVQITHSSMKPSLSYLLRPMVAQSESTAKSSSDVCCQQRAESLLINKSPLHSVVN